MPRARVPAYGPPRGAAERRALEEALGIAFEITPKQVRRWIAKAGPSCFRVLRDGGEVAGGCALYPMGHWFGGRRVAAFGVAGVAVLPHFRARGAATAMMRAAVLEMARRGAAVSTLYPATHPVYRRAGYESAGSWVLHSLRVGDLDARERGPSVRPYRPADRRAVGRLYEEAARPVPGMVDRTPYLWWRARGQGEPGARTWIVEGEDGPEGYFVLEQERRKTWPGPAYDLHVADHAFANPGAGRRMLAFLAAHRSLAGDLLLAGGPREPLLGLLEEPFSEVKRHTRWMLRVVDVRGALSGRGYPRGLDAGVALEIDDDLLDRNRGRWTLGVHGGRGRVARGGPGRVRVDIRGLAALYTGYLAPRDLRVQGRLEGPDEELEALAAIFAGPPPTMRDSF